MMFPYFFNEMFINIMNMNTVLRATEQLIVLNKLVLNGD